MEVSQVFEQRRNLLGGIHVGEQIFRYGALDGVERSLL